MQRAIKDGAALSNLDRPADPKSVELYLLVVALPALANQILHLFPAFHSDFCESKKDELSQHRKNQLKSLALGSKLVCFYYCKVRPHLVSDQGQIQSRLMKLVDKELLGVTQ